MSEFNFSLDNAQISSKSGNYFKFYTINKINKISAEMANGTTSDGKEWKAVDITFKGDEGEHRERYFIPATVDEGVTRATFANGGESPSPYEILKQLAVHVLGTYSTEAYDKFVLYCKKIKNMDQFVSGFIKLLNDAPSKELYLKVVGKNSKGTIYAKLPKPCGIEKDADGNFTDKTFPINFLSEKPLTFTAYEEKERAKLSNAKPTEMDSNVETNTDTNENNDDEEIDFSLL